jgi:hypothetical protein
MDKLLNGDYQIGIVVIDRKCQILTAAFLE